MNITPIVDPSLGNSSYLVDLGDGHAMVVDPERNPSPYLLAAERHELSIRWAIETHLHADFVSGGRELVSQGAQLLAPSESRLKFGHLGLSDGDEVDLGGLTLAVIATPGHTPEHCAYLLKDGTRPVALFSGGTLIAGGVARTDLISPDLTEELARAAYRSIKDRLLILPDDLAVYPTHGAGSFCSTAVTGQRTTTIGRERLSNPLLQAVDEDDFVRRLTHGLGSYPRYFLRLREVNQAGPKVYGPSPPALLPLTPEQVAEMTNRGSEVIDVRPIDRFAASHIPGSLSIALRDQFATWLGWLVDLDKVLVLVADPDQDLDEAVRQSLNIGYERIAGYLAGGILSWQQSGRSTSAIRVLGSDEISPNLDIVDVRQAGEWQAGHVPGAIHIELGEVSDQASRLTGELVLHCGHGHRAMTAASVLERGGAADIAVTMASAEELTRKAAASNR